MSDGSIVRETYLSRLLEIHRLDDGLVIVQGDSSIVIQREDELEALKRFIDKLLKETQ